MTTWLNTSFQMQFRVIDGLTVRYARITAPDGQLSGGGLHGRRGECQALDRLAANARSGHSQVLVLRGESGIGKTALLDYLAGCAAGCRIARVAGAEPETELALAGLHQLCAPFLERLGQLPGPQRDALRTAFSMRDGNLPDRFAVGPTVSRPGGAAGAGGRRADRRRRAGAAALGRHRPAGRAGARPDRRRDPG